MVYRASVAQWKAGLRSRRPKAAKLVTNPQLRAYVQDRLAGAVHAQDGTVIEGTATPDFKGRNKPRRQDRRWVSAWSPEQIAHRLKRDYPDDDTMRISHEAIYQALYVEGRGALKRELVACLRTGRALRIPRARSRNTPGGHVTADVVISERPPRLTTARSRVIGRATSSSGPAVRRSAPSLTTSRFTMLVHLPRLTGHGIVAPVKNGPALGGYGAEAMREALSAQMTELPLLLGGVRWSV